MDNEIIETAKAIQETAKTGGKAVDAGRELGGFFKEVFGELVKDSVGLASDWMKIYRQERLIVLSGKMHEKLRALGVTETVPISPKIAVPLIEHASLEDNEQIMDMWATLLAKALDPNSHDPVSKYQVDILSQLGPAEAALLHILWLSSESQSFQNGKNMNEAAIKIENEKSLRWRIHPTLVQKQAIHNITRLGLAAFRRTGLPINHLFMDDRGNPKSMVPSFSTKPLIVNPNSFERIVRAIDLQLLYAYGSIEPEVFQITNGTPEEERYFNPETGIHIIASGYYLMKTCLETSNGNI